MMKKTIVVLTAIALSACSSSIKSIKSPDTAVEGLPYFMPKKDILATITIKDNKITNVTLGTTSSYPDLSQRFVLRYDRNAFGKNTLDVGINEAGLLTSVKSTTVSNVTDAFKNLAATAGQLTPLALRMGVVGVKGKGCQDGVHNFVFEAKAEKHENCCGLNIEIEERVGSASTVPNSKKCNKEYSGIFYRQSIPYLVKVRNGFNVDAVVFSPSKSAIHFLPVSETFLSNNDADFLFVDGVPTKYKQDTGSELVALFALPADIISAYFTGIGKMFDSFKSKDEKEAQALAESLKLELAKKKYDACISAIKAGDAALIQALGCE